MRHGTTYLLALATAHLGGLVARAVDVGPELLFVGEGRRLGLLDGSVDLGLSLLVDRLEVILSREAPLGDVALETADGVLRGPDALDLVTRTVGGAGIGHAARGVRTVKGMRAARVTYE